MKILWSYSLLFLLLGISCHNSKITIDNTFNYIVFDKIPELGEIDDINVGMIDINTKQTIELTRDIHFREYIPKWLNDTELIYLKEPQEQTGTHPLLVVFNTKSGTVKIFDCFTGFINPASSALSLDLDKNLYCAGGSADYILTVDLKQTHPKARMIVNEKDVARMGLVDIFQVAVSPNGSELLVVVCDTAKSRFLKQSKIKDQYFDIYDYSITSGIMKKYIYDEQSVLYPEWIGADSFIYSAKKGDNYDLYIKDYRDGAVTRLTETNSIDEFCTDISPDHKYIAYTLFGDGSKNEGIYIMDLATKKSEFLIIGSSPSWSPAKR